MVRRGCVGAKNEGELFGPRCGAEAAFTSPLGFLCEQCAERAMDAIRSGETLLNMLAEKRGLTPEDLLKAYKRIQ